MNSEGGLGQSSEESAAAQSVSGIYIDLSGTTAFTEPTTSELINFANEPVSLATPRLVGCTSIIVVSNKGAWANHI